MLKLLNPFRLNLKNLSSYSFHLRDIEVRGEIFMKLDDFLKLNKEREIAGEKLFANPRNSAAGTLKMQDPRIVAKRKLSMFAYSLISNEDDHGTQFENLQYVKRTWICCKSGNQSYAMILMKHLKFAVSLKQNGNPFHMKLMVLLLKLIL